MKIKAAIVLSISFLGMIACYKTPTYPIEPHIEFVGYTKPNEIFTLGETGTMSIKFTDGDGDVGKLNNEDSTSLIIYRNLKDTVFFNTDNFYVIPQVPLKGTTNAISGTIEFKLSSALFNSYEAYFLFKGISIDTFTYKIYITDRANHKSNIIETPPIIVKYP